MPVFILSNLLIGTFYFIAGLVLLEKGEGTLIAQIVTPLRTWEYLASKVITLTFLALMENLLIVGLGYGLNFNLLPLLVGLISATALFILIGFVAVFRFNSINEYLFPSFLYTLLFIPPFLPYLGLGESWLFYLHPLQAPLLLTKAAFQPIATWQWLYGVLYAGLWIGLFLNGADRFLLSSWLLPQEPNEMKTVQMLQALGPIDAKSVSRDPLLRWMVFYPLLLSGLIRWGVPLLAVRLMAQFQFDLTSYYPLLTSFVLLMTPMLTGMSSVSYYSISAMIKH